MNWEKMYEESHEANQKLISENRELKTRISKLEKPKDSILIEKIIEILRKR